MRDDNLGHSAVSNSWVQAVRAGKAFEISSTDYAIANGESIALLADGSDLTIHFAGFFLNSNKGDFEISFIEAPVISGGTNTAVSPVNRNRNSRNVSKTGVTFIKNPVGVSGTTLTSLQITGGSSAVAYQNQTELPEEWVLKPNVSYAVYLVNKSGSAADISARMFWYEYEV